MQEQTLKTNTGSIFIRSWEIENPSANLFITHGLGEHSGRYTHLAEHFNQLGYNVFAHDHQGHGKSNGKQGHIDSFEIYTNDLKSVIVHCSQKQTNSSLKNHLLGHSLGGVIATGFLIRYPEHIERSIISAPGFEKKIPPNPIKAAIGKMLANISPKLTLWNEIKAEWICKTQSVVDAYSKDPLVHDRVSAKFFTSFLAEFEFIKNNISKITTPVLMLLPGSDLIVNHERSKEFFNLLGSSSKKLTKYPNAYHELLNEDDDKMDAYKEIQYWIK
jgi:acylglycerol lipase